MVLFVLSHFALAVRIACRFRRDGGLLIPRDLDYSLTTFPALSMEELEKLRHYRPTTLHEAGSIAGMTPAGLIYLHSYVRRLNMERRKAFNDNAP